MVCTRVALPRLLALGGPRVDGHLERRVEVAPQLTDKRFNSYIEKARNKLHLQVLWLASWFFDSGDIYGGARETSRAFQAWQQP